MEPESVPPERLTAILVAGELAGVLGAERREPATPERVVCATPDGGCTITCEPLNARVVVAGGVYVMHLTVLPERVSFSYCGDYSPEAFAAVLLLDWMHDTGQLPTDPVMLSAAQLVTLADLPGC